MFSQIRGKFRRTQQNVDAIHRQLEANPEAFKEFQKQAEEASKPEVDTAVAPEDGASEKGSEKAES